MHSIFFDLETSDRDFIGQILNYSFILVDEKFTTLDECSGTVSLTPLQAPSLGALLANRILVLDHKGERTEREAMLHIDAFFRRVTENNKVVLVGYNSSRFDVPFWRTVMIRNGINPYYGGALVYRDLYSAVQFLGCTDARFKAPIVKDDDDNETYSLSLENVSKAAGLLHSAQTHESREDVLLEIALAEHLHRQFGLHIAQWDPYLAHFAHSAQRGTVFHQLSWDREQGTAKRDPVVLWDVDRRNSLWLNLRRYEEKKPAWTLGKISGGQLFIEPFETGAELDRERVTSLASTALKEHGEMTLGRYFSRKSDCDIEQDIYRLDIVGIGLLHKALYFADERPLREAKIKDLTTLFVRAKLAVGNSEHAGFTDTLHKYGQYRYGGGQLLLSRYRDDEKLRFAASRSELLAEAEIALPDPSDEEIRMQLLQFYKAAPVLNWPAS